MGRRDDSTDAPLPEASMDSRVFGMTLEIARRFAVVATIALFTQACKDTGEDLDFREYRGSAKLWQDPSGSYHKPWLLFPEVRLDQPGVHEFTIHGLPRS